MADDFDPLKNEPNRTSQGSNIQKEQNKSNTNSLIHRPSYNSVWKRSTSQDEPQSPTGQSNHSTFTNIPLSSSPPPSNTVKHTLQRSTSASGQRQVHIIEQKPKPYWESGGNSFEDSSHDVSEGVHYASQHSYTGSEEEHYANGKPYKKKGVANKIDRFVQRFPALGKFYKQPLSSPNAHGTQQEFHYGQTSDLVYNHELTADDLALNQRYSDKTRIQLINLQVKEQTQPVDVSIHHQTNKIYLCDIGRSVVEIYDFNKTFEHIVDDSTMIKFQPTALAVADDGTIIIASHFNHCLHMYAPNDHRSETNQYSYKQFKLGVEGDQIHQFYQPAGISLDHTDGYLYVCDRGNCRIQVFTPDGICERVIELFLNSKKKYRLDPLRIALQKHSEQIVCIVGDGNALCFIPKYSNGRIYVDPFYIVDENGLNLENAAGLAVDAEDRIFISDTNHHRIVICTSDGRYITSFGTEGNGPGQLKRPCGLDLTNDGILVVTDPGNKRLQLFGIIPKKSSIQNNPPNANADDNTNLSTNPERTLSFIL